ncbi:uncharacterized protein METZ01_LOCUS498070 [marine metagenome]|uniref:Uncharacterized protein n=1 Tax=marine metagenome TaxID=408172 RepID=A0A383DL53_9ZZZZ
MIQLPSLSYRRAPHTLQAGMPVSVSDRLPATGFQRLAYIRQPKRGIIRAKTRSNQQSIEEIW